MIKEAQELSSLIYGKLANEAYENAMKKQAGQQQMPQGLNGGP